MFEFSQEETGDIIILSIKGDLDANTAPELRPTIDELVANRKTKVVFDLQELKIIDSSGVGAIVSLFKRLRPLGGDVKIARLKDQPKAVFLALGLNQVFTLFESVEEATGAFK